MNQPARRRRRRIWTLLALLACAGGAGVAAWQWRAERQEAKVAAALTGGDPRRAVDALRRFGCAGCHAVPGVPGAGGQVGPPLGSLRERVFIGGVLRNTPENLVRWIVDPKGISPETAMPVTGIDENAARDVAAYLYSH